MIQILGWMAVLRYLMGRLSLAEALDRISSRMGFKAGAVIMPYVEAAVDVDSVSDLELVKQIVAERKG